MKNNAAALDGVLPFPLIIDAHGYGALENTNGLLVHRDELLSLLKGLDREENVAARGFYLSGWNGTDDYTFDRIIRGKNLHLPSVTVSLVGSTQPGKFRDYAGSAIRGGASDDGLIQRFGLLVWPDVTGPWIEHDRAPDPVSRDVAFRAFERLDRMSWSDVGAQVDPFDDSKPFLRFDDGGLAVFQEWRAQHERRIRSGDLHPAMESHLAKYRKLIPTLALTHHLVSGKTGPVGELSVLSALAWGEFLESHANRIYSAAIDTTNDGAREIIRHLRKGDLESRFSAREVQRHGWSGLNDKDRVADALGLLEDYGWVRSVDVPPASKGGRPTVAFIANPTVRNQGKGAAMQRVEAARRLFPTIWIDPEHCSGGLEALGNYHEKKDDLRGIGLGPNHDWSSHGADAFGLMAVAKPLFLDRYVEFEDDNEPVFHRRSANVTGY